MGGSHQAKPLDSVAYFGQTHIARWFGLVWFVHLSSLTQDGFEKKWSLLVPFWSPKTPHTAYADLFWQTTGQERDLSSAQRSAVPRRSSWFVRSCPTRDEGQRSAGPCTAGRAPGAGGCVESWMHKVDVNPDLPILFFCIYVREMGKGERKASMYTSIHVCICCRRTHMGPR